MKKSLIKRVEDAKTPIDFYRLKAEIIEALKAKKEKKKEGKE